MTAAAMLGAVGARAAKPPTAPDPVPAAHLRRLRAFRRGGIVILAVFVALGLSGTLGIRTKTVSAIGSGYEMSLQYPANERSAQTVHWELFLRHPGGFDGKVDVGITQSYLDLLDYNDVEPQPSASRTSGPYVVWTFDPPDGDVLRVSLDAFIQANAHFGAGAEVAVFEGGVPVVSVHYRTWVAP
ncbi:MAG: hypothetical protein ABR600_04015 [Actinomycetota bacterium]